MFERNEAHRHYIRTKDIYQDFNQHLYEKLWDEIDNYQVFDIVYVNGHPIGMGGINTHYYNEGVARVLDRVYHFHRGIDGLRSGKKRVSEHLLKKQVDWCADNNIHTVFMSMEPKGNMERWQKYIGNKLNERFDMDFKFQDKYLYNVCKPLDSNCNEATSCWQSITVYKMTDNNSFHLPAIPVNE